MERHYQAFCYRGDGKAWMRLYLISSFPDHSSVITKICWVSPFWPAPLQLSVLFSYRVCLLPHLDYSLYQLNLMLRIITFLSDSISLHPSCQLYTSPKMYPSHVFCRLISEDLKSSLSFYMLFIQNTNSFILHFSFYWVHTLLSRKHIWLDIYYLKNLLLTIEPCKVEVNIIIPS